MTGKVILLNKHIWLAAGMIVFIGAVVASSTGAFFSSNASATGNTFAAGTMELKIAQNSGSGTPTGGWLDTQVSPLTFSGMAPGGDPSEGAVWLKNEGSIDGMSLGVAMDNASETVAGMGPLMRITQMDLGGNSLLEGGAGATIPEYEFAYNCDIEVNFGSNDYNKITDAITNANASDVICVGDGNYSSAWEGSSTITVDEEVVIASVNGPNTTQSIPFDVIADNVTIKGFEISDPNGRYGVSITNGASDVTVTHNEIRDLATNLSSGSAQAISVQNGASGGNGYIFSDNVIENIGNLNLIYTGGSTSAKGIYLGDTTASALDDVKIQNNIINNIQAGIAAWNAGRGAYGILTNVAGGVTNLVIENNTITNLEGLWSHAIGLEGDTDGATVRLNSISNLTDHKGGTDAAGIQFESNSFASTVTVSENNLTPNVAQGVRNTTVLSVTAQNNWWGDFDPSDQVLEDTGSVDTSNYAGGPFVGLVNGNDANGNGYADLQDLNNDPIVAAEIGLDAGEEKLFELGVQLDGPSTSNAYQNAEYETDFVFTLNQI